MYPIWSAGNESGEGFNISEVVQEGKKYDDTRSWMYGGNAFSHPAEDIIGPRYPRPDELEIQEGLGFDHDNRPSFMDEYLSVAGNACGSLDEYWRVIYTHPRIMVERYGIYQSRTHRDDTSFVRFFST